MGDDTIYSGTVAAATEGFLLGIPSIAISLVAEGGGHFDTAARVARELVQRFGARPLNQPVLLNVNVPGRELCCAARHGRHAARQAAQGRAGREVDDAARRSRFTGSVRRAARRTRAKGTDFHAAANGMVSITPLQVDLTRYSQMQTVTDWLGHGVSAAQRHRHDLAAHAHAHGRAPARPGHTRRGRARRDGRSAAPPLRRRSAGEPRLRGHRAAARLRADDLEPPHRRAHDRARARRKAAQQSARDRHGLRLPGGGAVAPRERRIRSRGSRRCSRKRASIFASCACSTCGCAMATGMRACRKSRRSMRS